MSSNDFAKIWNLFRSLFPASPRVNSENNRIIWEVALSPYSLDDVTVSVVAWARKSKFFPDIADITSKLEQVELPPENQPGTRGAKHGYGDTAWMAPYVRKMAKSVTDDEADELHKAGMQTWREAEAAGTEFSDWCSEYRERPQQQPK